MSRKNLFTDKNTKANEIAHELAMRNISKYRNVYNVNSEFTVYQMNKLNEDQNIKWRSK